MNIHYAGYGISWNLALADPFRKCPYSDIYLIYLIYLIRRNTSANLFITNEPIKQTILQDQCIPNIFY